MAEATFAETIIPGTFIQVRSDALISVGGISTGRIGLVATVDEADRTGAAEETHILSSYADGVAEYGASDAWGTGASRMNMTRVLNLLYANGARVVYTHALRTEENDPDTPANEARPGNDAYLAAFRELLKEDINILVAPELSTSAALSVFGTLTDEAETQGRDVIAVVGSDATTVANIKAQVATNDRVILVAPGIMAYDAGAGEEIELPGTYSAAPVAGLISSLGPHISPTNKVLNGVTRLARRFSYGETADLVDNRVLVLEQRQGVRVVRGITMDDGAFRQITTRRIVDYAKAGIRAACNPFIGRLNNNRVREAMRGTIDGFLTRMLQDEQLTGYSLEVTATRQDEIGGRVRVNATILPTFSIDYIMVTLVLE
ncbi:MAG TPA: phage tail sheath subtilisin-like domain-containing protein [Longimicrobium sp.]|nr:phage tail sheath subtilisin-like domain-containing protein [Longimicrobium sp.]